MTLQYCPHVAQLTGAHTVPSAAAHCHTLHHTVHRLKPRALKGSLPPPYLRTSAGLGCTFYITSTTCRRAAVRGPRGCVHAADV